MEEEIWKDIPGYEGYYQVSDLGRVRGIDREFIRKDKWGGTSPFKRKGRIIKNKLNFHGKYFVTLSKNNKVKEWHVAKLVLLAFVGTPESDQECCHRNDIQTDNRLVNLYWGTRKDNIRDKHRNDKVAYGVRAGNSKLKDGEVWLIKKLLHNKIKKTTIAKMFKVTRQSIRHIELNNVWKHITYNEGVLV